MRRGGFTIVPAALATALALLAPASAHAGGWIADAKTGCKVWNPNPSQGETAHWVGPCKDGFAEGMGTLDWRRAGASFERDEGAWHAGRQSGEGTQAWPQGRYQGQLLDSLPGGPGKLTLGERRYEGSFQRGKPEGAGTLTEPSGVITGAWHEGCFNNGVRRAAVGVPLQTCP